MGDSNPLYRDAAYAARSRYGDIIAPPGYVSSLWYWGSFATNDQAEQAGLMQVIIAISGAGYRQAIDTGIEYEFFLPVRVGDMIKAETVVKDIVERGSGEEGAVFLFSETTYTNQDGEVVATSKITTAHR